MVFMEIAKGTYFLVFIFIFFFFGKFLRNPQLHYPLQKYLFDSLISFKSTMRLHGYSFFSIFFFIQFLNSNICYLKLFTFMSIFLIVNFFHFFYKPSLGKHVHLYSKFTDSSCLKGASATDDLKFR